MVWLRIHVAFAALSRAKVDTVLNISGPSQVNFPERIFVLLFMFFALSAFAVSVASLTQAENGRWHVAVWHRHGAG